jgi:hypothetical protein
MAGIRGGASGGHSFDLVFLALIGWAGGLFWLSVGYIGLQFSSNIGQGPAQGLLPDRVAVEKLGMASGVKTFMDMAALIIASLAAGRLLGPQGNDPTLIILVLMVVMVISAGITVFATPEEPTTKRKLVEGTSRAVAYRFQRKQRLLVVDRTTAGFFAGNLWRAGFCPVLFA